MNGINSVKRIGALLFVLALAACGGSDDGGSSPGAQPAGTVVGAAGGTVVGPNGASVVIPAGALTADTTIGIEQTDAGAPPLPGGFTVFGRMFAFTPHGTTFAVPVTVTLPFDSAAVAAGAQPELHKTNAQNRFERVAGATFGTSSVSAQVTSFSFAGVVIPPLFSGGLVREWSFSDYRGLSMIKTELSSDRQEGGVLEKFETFGSVFPFTSELLDHEITSIDGTVIPQDRIANGQVFSSADGVTYGVFAEAPWSSASPVVAGGGVALLRQFQAFVKRSADATLTFTLTSAFIDLRDDNGGFSNNSNVPGCVYPPNQIGSLDPCQDLVSGQLTLAVKAYTHATGPATPGRTFFQTAGIASAKGHQRNFSTSVASSMLATTPLWSVGDFDVDISPGFNFLFMNFKEPRTYVVDLSSVAVGEEFTINSAALAEATDRPGNKSRGQREGPSAAAAFLRDPLAIGGTSLAFTGIETIDKPAQLPPADVPVAPAACVPGPGPDPLAGVIQFSAANYSIDELGGATQPIRITRTGGSRGAVTATFTTSNGTAIGGTDFSPVNATVFFADGDAAERVAEVPIIQNLIDGEPTKTVNLTLSQPGGCAALGSQVTALLTILDDDQPAPPPAFTIGGTVTGLVGTGLVLQDLKFLPITPGNGTFTFAAPTNTGSPYAVTIVTQPTNPLQICTVTNGSGTVANANITNVAVDCVTSVVSGALDASFGGGKVSTAFGGDETAMALQADGKIVMVGGSGTDFVLARYNADGSLDASFGTAGLVTHDVGSGSADEARAVAIQPDGKIVVAGHAVVGRNSRNLFNFDFALARYNADGSPDTSFGTLGKVTTDFNGETDQAHGVAIQSDGRIVVVGSVGFFSSATSVAATDFGVARYDSNGTLDGSFGAGGKRTTDIAGGTDIAHNVVVQPNGAILVSGPRTAAGDPGLDHAGLARYDAAGNPDGSFGAGGKVALLNMRVGEGLALQGDGKIVLAGSVSVGIFPARSSQLALMRLDASGSPDGGFGSAGLVTTPFSTLDDFGRAVAVQADGKIVVTGQSSNQSNPDFAVARFNANGTLDAGFGSGGKLTIDFFGAFDGAENVAIQPDGKIVLGGFAVNGTRTGYGLARVLP